MPDTTLDDGAFRKVYARFDEETDMIVVWTHPCTGVLSGGAEPPPVSETRKAANRLVARISDAELAAVVGVLERYAASDDADDDDD